MKRIADWYWRRGWSSREALGSAVFCAVAAIAAPALRLIYPNYGWAWTGAVGVVVVFAAASSIVLFPVARQLRARDDGATDDEE
jgi:membrane protein implicated in regulation of membrane protease activity